MGVTSSRPRPGLREAGADVVGSNCGNGIDDMVAIARELARADAAADPHPAERRAARDATAPLVYEETPELMAARVPELLDARRRDRRRLLRHDARAHPGDSRGGRSPDPRVARVDLTGPYPLFSPSVAVVRPLWTAPARSPRPSFDARVTPVR